MTVESFMDSVVRNAEKSGEIKTDDIPLPDNLPADLVEVFVSKTTLVDDKKVNKLTREIVSNFCHKGIKPSDQLFKKASKRAEKRWSPLKVKGDPKRAGISMKLKRRYEKVLRKSKQKPQANLNLAVMDTFQNMTDDWEQNLRTPSVMKAHMETLRESRMRAALKECAADHIQKYPALRIIEVLLRELEAIVGTTYAAMETKWYSVLPKLVELIADDKRRQLNTLSDDASNFSDEKTRRVLQNLHLLKVWHKSSNDSNKRCRILELFPENTPLAENWGKNKEPPRLITIENGCDSNQSYHCFVDISPLFAVTNPVQALRLLLAAFYAFNINWTPNAKLPLFLLVSIILGPQQIMSKASNNSKFVALLRTLGIDV